MTVDPTVLPGLLFIALELLALAALGFVVARVAIGQSDDWVALAKGLVIGPAMWGLVVNFVLHVLQGRTGALVGWVIVVVLTAGVAWRAPSPVWPRLRTLVGFAGAGLVVFWMMLVARQLLSLCDAATHLGMSASIEAGGWPPSISWIPDQPLIYHYGIDLLVGLLAPPFGPNLPFTMEILGAYVWTGFALVVATALRRCGGRIALLTLTPMLLTPGSWTLGGVSVLPKDILQIPVPFGLPAPGLRASLADLYWPEPALEAVPPNIANPAFVLSYALAFVVLVSAASSRCRSWLATLALAALVGFLGLLGEEIALLVLALWSGLEAVRVFSFPRPSLIRRTAGTLPDPAPASIRSASSQLPEVDKERASMANMLMHLSRAVAGPALAGLLLAVGGGAISSLLIGKSIGASSLVWLDDPGSRSPFGTLLDLRAGGVGVIGFGVVPVVIAAVVLARRSRLVLALVTASGVFLLAALLLQYEPKQDDVTRLDGHARNFALLAFLIALAYRLANLRPRWRYFATVGVVTLLVWPTVAAQARGIPLILSRGVQLANAQPEQRESDPEDMHELTGRFALVPFASDRIAAYIRSHTEVNARIFSPYPYEMSATTGRPNASGFAGLIHLSSRTGPAFEDMRRYLEPGAVQRLGYAYIHATDNWVAKLPERAQHWLADPQLFELLLRDGADALYRIQPEFLRLNPRPTPQSFEALRKVVPASAAVYLTVALDPVTRTRLASVLAHARLLGDVDQSGIYLLTNIPIEPLGMNHPDVVIMPQGSTSFFRASVPELPLTWREPAVIWRSHGLVAYAAIPTSAPAMDVLAQTENEATFEISVSEIDVRGDTITFAARFTDRAPERWTGQDWLVVPLEDTPWVLPTTIAYDGHTLLGGAQWYPGHVVPGQDKTTRVFQFDPLEANLAVQGKDGRFSASKVSGSRLNQGVWMLTLRLRTDYLQAAVVPVIKIVISETGGVSYTVYEHGLDALIDPCPEQLSETASCRRLMAADDTDDSRSSGRR